MKTRAVNVRLKLPTFRSFDLVAEHRLVLVGAHHVLRRGSVPRQWIRLKVRFTQPSIGFMALLFDETNLELNALGKAPFRSSCPTDFGDAIGFIKSSRLVPGQLLKSAAAQLHAFNQRPPRSIFATPLLHHANVQKVASITADLRSVEQLRGCAFQRSGDQIDCATRCLGSKSYLAAALEYFNGTHPGEGGEIVGRWRGVRCWRHQNAVLHQGDARASLRT